MLSPAAVLCRITGVLVAFGGLAFAVATCLPVLQDGLLFAVGVSQTSTSGAPDAWVIAAMYGFFLAIDAGQILTFLAAAGLGATAALRAASTTRASAAMALGGAVLCVLANGASLFHMGGMFCGIGMMAGVTVSLVLVGLAAVAFARAGSETSEEEVPAGW